MVYQQHVQQMVITNGIQCTICGDWVSGGTTIPALGHEYSEEFTVDTEATCTKEGSKSKHCTRCDSKTDVTIIEAKGHNYGIVSSPYGSTWEYYGKCDLIKYDGDNTGIMCNVETHEVQKGSTCYSVGVLQTLLNDLGYKGSDNKTLTVDCIFGGNTDKACKAFQKDNKLTVDGICGSKTWGKLLNG